MSTSIALSAASENGKELPAFANDSATVPGKGNAFILSHVGYGRHVGNGMVFPVYLNT